MDLAELVVREQIRETIARYNFFGDRGRFNDMVEQFHPDGELELVDAGVSYRGRTALREFFAGVASSFAASERQSGQPRGLLRHCVTNTLIEVESEYVARADSYFLVITDAGLDHWGRYRDDFRPCDGRWLLVHRRVRTDGWTPGSPFAAAEHQPGPRS